MDLSNFDYCYLDKVYVNTNNEPVLYQVILSDEHFLKIYSLIVDIMWLQTVLEENSLCVDFSIQNGQLSSVKVDYILVSDDISKNKMIPVEIYDNTYNFYNFIKEGIEQDYKFIGDSVVDCDYYKGTEISSFKNIRFSKSTMTITILLYTNSGLYNKMIVTATNGVLTLQEFYFATQPNQSIRAGTYVKSMQINNVEYAIYKSKILNLYTENYVTSHALINKAAISRQRYNSIVSTLSDLRDSLTKCDSTKTSWVGGATDYRENFGLYFKPSEKMLSIDERVSIIKTVSDKIIPHCSSYSDATRLASEIFKTKTKIICCSVISFCCYNSHSEAELLEYIHTVTSKYKMNMLYADLFLYTVRTGAYIRKRHLTEPTVPVLVGSDENGSTLVEHMFKREVAQ